MHCGYYEFCSRSTLPCSEFHGKLGRIKFIIGEKEIEMEPSTYLLDI